MSTLAPTFTVTVRPVEAGDGPFLRRVYASTRKAEMALVDWSDAQKQAFLDMQFTAQDRHYHWQFPDAAFEVILVDGVPAGRCYVHRQADHLRLVEIALLPEYRGAGIGTRMVQELQAEAAQACAPLLLSVEATNRAADLYLRLGFTLTGEGGMYREMRWRA